MWLHIGLLRPCTVARTWHVIPECCVASEPARLDERPSRTSPASLLLDSARLHPLSVRVRLSQRWREYQGIRNWEGMLDPLDNNLRDEIVRYGHFVEAAYRAFDFDIMSPTYGTCRFPRSSLLERSGLPGTGYRLTKNLRATSSIRLPRWMDSYDLPSWMAARSTWIGYVGVCEDREEIERLGRRDVVVAYRGTATCLEWLENLRANLTHLPGCATTFGEPMVERGFFSLYTSGTHGTPSLQTLVREEIERVLQSYGDEPLSLTITGHSLGAALATLTAHDIKTTFKNVPLITVISFGGPRVGNWSFRRRLEQQGVKILRIVNSDDVVTKVPGFTVAEVEGVTENLGHAAAGWLRRAAEGQWMYADVGRELRLRSRDSPYLGSGANMAVCHELKTYLHLVSGFESSKCPFRATTKRMMGNRRAIRLPRR
ncbi:Phospholipase A(1) [Bertholletia excelsa]